MCPPAGGPVTHRVCYDGSMDVKINKNIEQSEAELIISANQGEFGLYIAQAASKLSTDRQIKGFRPGKAPVEVVAEALGWERLLNTALDAAIPRFFVQAVLDNDIDAIAKPSIVVEAADRSQLVFKAKVAILPEVVLGDLAAIEVSKRPVLVNDEDVDKELKRLAKMRSDYIEVAKPAAEGDTIRIDYTITVGGVVIEGGEAKNQMVHLGEGYMVADFEKKLLGMRADETREFTFKFPDDYSKKNWRGREAQARAKVLNVQKRVLPEINDEFAKKLGRFDSLNHLKTQMRENIQTERKQKEQDRFQGEMTEKLAQTAKYSVIPEALIDREIDRLIGEFSSLLAWQNKTIDDYLREKDRTLAAVRDEMRPNAEKSVKAGLALRTFAAQEKITVDEKEAEEKVQEYLRRFASDKQAANEIDPEELKEQLMYTLRNQKALAELEKKIRVISN